MFKKNIDHVQTNLFGLKNSLSESSQKYLEKSEEFCFYKIIFCTIQEELFAPLYSDKKSRPNAAINAMISALILMNRYQWTYEELFKHLRFNILTRTALGIDNLDDMPFCQATLFNFQNRLNDYFIKTGVNLLEQVFDQLSTTQLKELKLKTNIQRTDSLMAASNIRRYSRIQLLIELLIRMYRILSDEDKKRFKTNFGPYVTQSSGQYIYKLAAPELPHELEKLGQLYLWIYQHIYPSYSDCAIMQTFERVLREHFIIEDEKIVVKRPDQLRSDSVQSPDDLDATYRDKNGKKSKGQAITVTETAHPDNPLNLLHDISVDPNNSDGSTVLHKRLDGLIWKTPDLSELYIDGEYGSADNDVTFEHYRITPVQTGVRGSRQPAVTIEIKQQCRGEYTVSCPQQQVSALPTRKRLKACFDGVLCNECPLRKSCPTLIMIKNRVFYFTHKDYLRQKRLKAITTLPPERQKLRNNVEATVNEFVCKMRRGKLKVRGAFKTALFAYTVGMSINFGRIYRFLQQGPAHAPQLGLHSFCVFKEQVICFFSSLIEIIEIFRQESNIGKPKPLKFTLCMKIPCF